MRFLELEANSSSMHREHFQNRLDIFNFYRSSTLCQFFILQGNMERFGLVASIFYLSALVTVAIGRRPIWPFQGLGSSQFSNWSTWTQWSPGCSAFNIRQTRERSGDVTQSETKLCPAPAPAPSPPTPAPPAPPLLDFPPPSFFDFLSPSPPPPPPPLPTPLNLSGGCYQSKST